LIPAGLEVTVPPPLTVTVTLCVLAGVVNAAVTAASAEIVTEQAEAPLQAPLHAVKLAPPVGDSARVTAVPSVKLAVH
jgi:hypothetical protein